MYDDVHGGADGGTADGGLLYIRCCEAGTFSEARMLKPAKWAASTSAPASETSSRISPMSSSAKPAHTRSCQRRGTGQTQPVRVVACSLVACSSEACISSRQVPRGAGRLRTDPPHAADRAAHVPTNAPVGFTHVR